MSNPMAMDSDRDRPHTMRSRFRARSRRFSFRWSDNRILEETLGIYLPTRNASYVIGRGRIPRDSRHTYYFDKQGRPADAETENWLHREMCLHMFLHRGRLYRMPDQVDELRTPEDYERWLRRTGLSPTAGANRHELLECDLNRADGLPGFFDQVDGTLVWVDEDERLANLDLSVSNAVSVGDEANGDVGEGPRLWPKWVSASRSVCHAAILSRLSVLFEPRTVEDPLIHRLADYLSRDESWHEWWYDRELDPLRRELHELPWRWLYVRALECAALVRTQVMQGRRVAQKPMAFVFGIDGAKWRFSVPRRHPQESERKHQEAVRALRLLWAARVAVEGLGRPDRVDRRSRRATQG